MSARRHPATARTAAILALLALAVAGCGGEDGAAGRPAVQWYINPDDDGQAEIAARCTDRARGRYRIETSVLPRSASDQREQLADLLVAGIRPEQLRDATRLDEGERGRSVHFRARVDVIEWLGDEQIVYVPYETSSAVQHQLAELARELDAETPRTQLIAALDAETGVAEGQQIELALDPASLHLFDPVTGTRLAHEPLPRAA